MEIRRYNDRILTMIESFCQLLLPNSYVFRKLCHQISPCISSSKYRVSLDNLYFMTQTQNKAKLDSWGMFNGSLHDRLVYFLDNIICSPFSLLKHRSWTFFDRQMQTNHSHLPKKMTNLLLEVKRKLERVKVRVQSGPQTQQTPLQTLIKTISLQSFNFSCTR